MTIWTVDDDGDNLNVRLRWQTIRTKDDDYGKLQCEKLSGKRSLKLTFIVVKTDIILIANTRLSKLLRYHHKAVYRKDAKDDSKAQRV